MDSPIDELFTRLGKPGRYQTAVCFLLCLNFIPMVYHYMSLTFYAAEPLGLSCGNNSRSWSVRPQPHNWTTVNRLGIANLSTSGQCVIYDFREGRDDWCEVRSECLPCNDSSPIIMRDGESTIVAEFDLVCDRQYLANLVSSIYFLGRMTGGVLVGHLADDIGRWPAMLLSAIISTAAGVGWIFSTSFVVFAVLTFIIGFGTQGLHNTSVILCMELFCPRYRGVAVLVQMLFWAFGILALGIIAFFVRDWRSMQMWASGMNGIMLFYICFLPESLRWLLSRKKADRAEELTLKITRLNGLKEQKAPILVLLKKLTNYGGRKKSLNFIHLIRFKITLIRSVILWFIWFAFYMGYYGLILNISALYGDIYVNFFIGAAIEGGVRLLILLLPRRLGRRKPLCAYYFIAGVSCIVAGNIEDGIVRTALAAVGRFGFSGVSGVIYLFTTELYPTLLRNAGFGSCTFWAGVGGVLAPQVNLVGLVGFPRLPLTLFGSLSGVSAILVLVLPETSGRSAPDTPEHSEQMGWGVSQGLSMIFRNLSKADVKSLPGEVGQTQGKTADGVATETETTRI